MRIVDRLVIGLAPANLINRLQLMLFAQVATRIGNGIMAIVALSLVGRFA
jgi:Na+/citrate or Na+/malate symporter